MRVAQRSQQRTRGRERLPPADVDLAPVHERRVGADRDVVQEQALAGTPNVDATLPARECLERRHGIAPVEAEIPGEVIAGPEGNADERQVVLDRDLCDRRQRAVAAGDSDCLRIGRTFRGNRCRVFALAQYVRSDSPSGRPVSQFLDTDASPADRGLISKSPPKTARA